MAKVFTLKFSLMLGLLIAPLLSIIGQTLNKTWPVLKSYKGEQLKEVAMPLGGIGTGTISIGGRGDLRDWEMANRGALGWVPAVKLVEPTIANGPFFAMYYKQQGKPKGELRLLEGPIESNFYGDWGSDVLNAGFPRFDATEFSAAYPLAQVQFKRKDMPLSVRLETFNPMIPGDVDNSSLPVAVLRYVIKNTSAYPMEVSICGMIPNFVGMDGWSSTLKNNVNTFRKEQGLQGLYMYSDSLAKTNVNWGTMALSTTSNGKVTYRRTWAKLGWNWTFREFIDDFTADGELSENFLVKNKNNQVSGTIEDLLKETARFDLATPPATLAVKETLAPGQEKLITFLITWHFPNRRGWDIGLNRYSGGFGSDEIVGNYYTNQFADAWDAAGNIAPQLASLEKRTVDFVSALCKSDIPGEIKEAALFNSANMRCQTLFRTKDGYPFGFEGTGSVKGTLLGGDKSSGWGFGTCSHVWNYESAIPFLFGDLSMKFREVEFLYSVNDNGGMSHRVGLPLEKKGTSFKHWAADGQMGTLVKIYRDWQLSGRNEELKKMWPNIKKAMAFAWTGPWDTDKDGVMEGSQHNTMDIEYYGPNPQMSAWYLAALKATKEMALYMKDEAFADECQKLYEKGRSWVDKNLFNGEYYEQIIPKDHNRVAQLGKGCLVDQLVGQYLAHTANLGYVLDKEKQQKTLRSIYKYNWVDDFNNHTNTFRSYALGNEQGLRMASYPRGELLDFPFPYYTELMTGFEYSTAVHMIYEGQRQEGLRVFKAIRDRYDGKKRNPFNEGEYGHRYARAMASWAGILAWTGFHYSAVTKTMKFNDLRGTYFWSNGYQYGTINISNGTTGKSVSLTSVNGDLELNEFSVSGFGTVSFNKGKIFKKGVSQTFTIQKR